MTAKEQRVLGFIRGYWDTNSYAPTYQEIADGCGLGGKAHAQYYVRSLEALGMLTHVPRRVRTTVVTGRGWLQDLPFGSCLPEGG